MDHFKGRIYAWDVVNESLNDDGTFRETPFYNITNSSSYIYDAFTTARSVGDKAKLYIVGSFSSGYQSSLMWKSLKERL